MSNRWIFFPAPAVSGLPKLRWSGDLVFYNSSRFNASNQVLTGTDSPGANYIPYTSFPVRKTTTLIELLFGINTSGAYTSSTDWVSAVTAAGGLNLSSSTWSHGGAVLAATSISYASAGPGVARVRWNASSTVITNFWATMQAGETSTVSIDW